MRHPLQTALRLVQVYWMLRRAKRDILRRNRQAKGQLSQAERNEWRMRCSQEFLRILHVNLRVVGSMPATGLLASNHLSYVDILVLGSLGPATFLSKAEVRQWPLLGWLIEQAGTLFIRREQKTELKDLTQALTQVVNSDGLLLLFPEGTSSNGRQVLPFHSSLFAPAVRHGWIVTPVWVGYRVAEGSAEEHVCFWRDMTFLPHLLNLCALPTIEATVAFGRPRSAAGDRKALARTLRNDVLRLRSQHATELMLFSW